MCDASVVLLAVATAITAYGQYVKTTSDNEAAKYNARVLENQADTAEQQIEQDIAAGKANERELRQRVSVVKGKQRAAAAAAGVEVDAGSSLDILEDSSGSAALDSLSLRYNTAQTVWGRRVQAHEARQSAYLSRKLRRPVGINSSATLLSGTSRSLDQWNKTETKAPKTKDTTAKAGK
jgi:hypothetical protein